MGLPERHKIKSHSADKPRGYNDNKKVHSPQCFVLLETETSCVLSVCVEISEQGRRVT